MNIKEMIGARVRELRVKQGLTQDQLSERMEISSNYLGNIERGKENPTLNTLIRLGEALGVDLGAIFYLVQVEDPTQRKSLVHSLLEEADSEQLKLIGKVLAAIVR